MIDIDIDYKEYLYRALAELKDLNKILFEVFELLTHDLDDPANINGECRVSIIVALNPVSCLHKIDLRTELGMPEYNTMSTAERDAVLMQYPAQLLKAHAEQILWILQALKEENRFLTAKYNVKIVEDFIANLNPQGGTHVIKPSSSQATFQQ